MSRRDVSLGRRSLLMRAGLAVLGAGLLAGCAEGIGDGGTLLDGRTRLPPLAAAPPAGHATVQMLPFTGIPVTIGDGIYHRFRERAKETGIELVHRLDEPAHFRIQGHFVAIGHETSTTIIFTYEIFDAAGRRVHRIVGQEVARLTDGDPWSRVDTEVEERLAVRAVRAIKAWLTRAAT
ncbi:MAG: hypothetical protein OEL76_01320 [Siculibacillus sp.]|nr:hypothetical protein [Siculibacillus sp.]